LKKGYKVSQHELQPSLTIEFQKGAQMKTKIFKVSGYRIYFGNKPKSKQVLEDEINNWLEANSDIKIVDIKQSCCGGSLEPSQTIVSIWYEPKK